MILREKSALKLSSYHYFVGLGRAMGELHTQWPIYLYYMGKKYSRDGTYKNEFLNISLVKPSNKKYFLSMAF